MRRALGVVLLMTTTLLPAASGMPAMRAVARRELCVTLGAVQTSESALLVESAKMRAVVGVRSEPTAELGFTFLGPTRETAPLASGQTRRQIGLKLRALDGCNLVYVMYRIEPKASLVVSVKRNPGQRTHAECGARGYTNIKPANATAVPEVHVGDHHVLGATLTGRALVVRLDGAVVWQGDIGSAADGLEGPIGVRSDNGRFRFELRAPVGAGAPPECSRLGTDDEP